jgi:predicted alpha/beta superfamily hydrolase
VTQAFPVRLASRIERHAAFDTKRVVPRNVDVHLPAGYDLYPDRWYPVVYMHDGQNLFDPETSFSGVAWGVDRTLDRLSREEGIAEAIVVGIWNSPRRIREYMPQRAMEDFGTNVIRRRFAETYGGAPCSDDYLAFLVHELKPFIDARYRTRPEAEATLVMGSSMGGLVSVYALCEHPSVFGGAGCLSTSWTVAGRIMLQYLHRRLPAAGGHRLYFDFGVEAQIGRYESLQKAVDRIVHRAGYRRGRDWLSERFQGEPHSEAAWRDRFDVPARFFFGQDQPRLSG